MPSLSVDPTDHATDASASSGLGLLQSLMKSDLSSRRTLARRPDLGSHPPVY